MKKYIIPFFITALLTAQVSLGAGVLGPGNGGNLTPGLWIPSTASSTITPNPNTLQVPCANIVGGCGGGGGASTSTTNTFTVPQNFNGISNTGNVTSTSYTAQGTTTSNIESLNSELFLNPGFATLGAAGSSTATTFQAAITALANSQVGIASGTTIHINFNIPSSTWSGPLVLNQNGLVVSIQCSSGVTLKYGGTGQALDFNNGNPAGHLVSDDHGCTYMGHATLIAAAQTNTATTTGIVFGGNNGAVGIDFHDNNVNGFGRDIEIGQNAYMLTIVNNSVSGGNGGGMKGDLLFINPANNSGERNVISGNFVDPGNSTATNDIYISDGGTASNFFSYCSLDDVQVYVGYSNGQTSFDHCHVENAAYGTYHAYIPFYATSSQATMLSLTSLEIANDANNATDTFNTIVKHGVNLYASGIHIDNYNGQTISKFADHTLNNGSESEVVCQIQTSNGSGLTSIVINQAYSQAAGATCTQTVANSYPISLIQNTNNVADIRNGNANIATFDNNGNWTLGITGTGGSLAVQGNTTVTGAITTTGAANVGGALNVTTTATVQGAATLNSSLTQSGGTASLASTTVTGTMSVTGPTTLLGVTQASGTQYYALAPSTSTVVNASTTTINWNSGNVQSILLQTSTVVTFSNTNKGGRYLLSVLQDGTGSRTITWPSQVQWPGGTAPTLTATANKLDIITFVCLGVSSTNCYAGSNLNYTP